MDVRRHVAQGSREAPGSIKQQQCYSRIGVATAPVPGRPIVHLPHPQPQGNVITHAAGRGNPNKGNGRSDDRWDAGSGSDEFWTSAHWALEQGNDDSPEALAQKQQEAVQALQEKFIRQQKNLISTHFPASASPGTSAHRRVVQQHQDALLKLMTRLKSHKVWSSSRKPTLASLTLPDSLHLLLLGVPAANRGPGSAAAPAAGRSEPGSDPAEASSGTLDGPETAASASDTGPGATQQKGKAAPGRKLSLVTAQYQYAHALLCRHTHASPHTTWSPKAQSSVPDPGSPACEPPWPVFEPLFKKGIEVAQSLLLKQDPPRPKASKPPETTDGSALTSQTQSILSSAPPAVPSPSSFAVLPSGSKQRSSSQVESGVLDDSPTPAFIHNSMYRLLRVAHHSPLRHGITLAECDPGLAVLAWAVSMSGCALAACLSSVDINDTASVEAAAATLNDIVKGAARLKQYERQQPRLPTWGHTLHLHALSQLVCLLLQWKAASGGLRSKARLQKQLDRAVLSLKVALSSETVQGVQGSALPYARPAASSPDTSAGLSQQRYALIYADAWHRLGEVHASAQEYDLASQCFQDALSMYEVFERGSVDNLQEFHEGQDYMLFAAQALDARAQLRNRQSSSVCHVVWLHRQQTRCASALINAQVLALQSAHNHHAAHTAHAAASVTEQQADSDGVEGQVTEVVLHEDGRQQIITQPLSLPVSLANDQGSNSSSSSSATPVAVRDSSALESASTMATTTQIALHSEHVTTEMVQETSQETVELPSFHHLLACSPAERANRTLAAFCELRAESDMQLVQVQSDAQSVAGNLVAAASTQGAATGAAQAKAPGLSSASASSVQFIGRHSNVLAAVMPLPGASLSPTSAPRHVGVAEEQALQAEARELLLYALTQAQGELPAVHRACLVLLQSGFAIEHTWKLAAARAAMSSSAGRVQRRRAAVRADAGAPELTLNTPPSLPVTHTTAGAGTQRGSAAAAASTPVIPPSTDAGVPAAGPAGTASHAPASAAGNTAAANEDDPAVNPMVSNADVADATASAAVTATSSSSSQQQSASQQALSSGDDGPKGGVVKGLMQQPLLPVVAVQQLLDVDGVGVASPHVAKLYCEWYRKQTLLLINNFKKRLASRCGHVSKAISSVGAEAFAWFDQHHGPVNPDTTTTTSAPEPSTASIATAAAASEGSSHSSKSDAAPVPAASERGTPASQRSTSAVGDVQAGKGSSSSSSKNPSSLAKTFLSGALLLRGPDRQVVSTPDTARDARDPWQDVLHHCTLLLKLWQERPAGVVAEPRQQIWLVLAAALLESSSPPVQQHAGPAATSRMMRSLTYATGDRRSASPEPGTVLPSTSWANSWYSDEEDDETDLAASVGYPPAEFNVMPVPSQVELGTVPAPLGTPARSRAGSTVPKGLPGSPEPPSSPAATLETPHPGAAGMDATGAGTPRGAQPAAGVLTGLLPPCAAARGTALRMQALYEHVQVLATPAQPQSPLNLTSANLVSLIFSTTLWHARVIANLAQRKGNIDGLLAEALAEAGLAGTPAAATAAQLPLQDSVVSPAPGSLQLATGNATSSGKDAGHHSTDASSTAHVTADTASAPAAPAVTPSTATARQLQQVVSGMLTLSLQRKLVSQIMAGRLRPNVLRTLMQSALPVDMKLHAITWLLNKRSPAAVWLAMVGLRDLVARHTDRSAPAQGNQQAHRHATAPAATTDSGGAAGNPPPPTLSQPASQLARPTALHLIRAARQLIAAALCLPQRHAATALACASALVTPLGQDASPAVITFFKDSNVALLKAGPHPYLMLELSRALVSVGSPAAIAVAYQLARYCAAARVDHALEALLLHARDLAVVQTRAGHRLYMPTTTTTTALDASPDASLTTRGAAAAPQVASSSTTSTPAGPAATSSTANTATDSAVTTFNLLLELLVRDCACEAGVQAAALSAAAGDHPGVALTSTPGTPLPGAARKWLAVRLAECMATANKQGVLISDGVLQVVIHALAGTDAGSQSDVSREQLKTATTWAVGPDLVDRLERSLMQGRVAHTLLTRCGPALQARLLGLICAEAPHLAMTSLSLIIMEAGEQLRPASSVQSGLPNSRLLRQIKQGVAAEKLLRAVSAQVVDWSSPMPSLLVAMHRVHQAAVVAMQQHNSAEAQHQGHSADGPTGEPSAPSAPTAASDKPPKPPASRHKRLSAVDATHPDKPQQLLLSSLLPAAMSKVIMSYAILGCDAQTSTAAAGAGAANPSQAGGGSFQADPYPWDDVLQPPMRPKELADHAVYLVSLYFTYPADLALALASNHPQPPTSTDATSDPTNPTTSTNHQPDASETAAETAARASYEARLRPYADALYELLSEVLKNRLDKHPALSTLLRAVCTVSIKVACTDSISDRSLLVKALLVATNSDQLPAITPSLTPRELLRSASIGLQFNRHDASRLLLKQLAAHGLRSSALAPHFAEFINSVAMAIPSTNLPTSSTSTALHQGSQPCEQQAAPQADPSQAQASEPVTSRPAAGQPGPQIIESMGGCEPYIAAMLVQLARDQAVDLSRALTAAAKRLAIRLCVAQGRPVTALKLWAAWQARHSVLDVGWCVAGWLLVACAEVGDWHVGAQLMRFLGPDVLLMSVLMRPDEQAVAPAGSSSSSSGAMQPGSLEEAQHAAFLSGLLHEGSTNPLLRSRVLGAYLRILAALGGVAMCSSTTTTTTSSSKPGRKPSRPKPLKALPEAVQSDLSVSGLWQSQLHPGTSSLLVPSNNQAWATPVATPASCLGDLAVLDEVVKGRAVLPVPLMPGDDILFKLKRMPKALLEMHSARAAGSWTEAATNTAAAAQPASDPLVSGSGQKRGRRRAADDKGLAAGGEGAAGAVGPGEAASAVQVAEAREAVVPGSVQGSHSVVAAYAVLEFLLQQLQSQGMAWHKRNAKQLGEACMDVLATLTLVESEFKECGLNSKRLQVRLEQLVQLSDSCAALGSVLPRSSPAAVVSKSKVEQIQEVLEKTGRGKASRGGRQGRKKKDLSGVGHVSKAPTAQAGGRVAATLPTKLSERKR